MDVTSSLCSVPRRDTRSAHSNILWTNMMLILLFVLTCASLLSGQSTMNGSSDSMPTVPSEIQTGGTAAQSTVSGSAGGSQAQGRTCRDRSGSFPPDVFKLWTCGMCFQYLYFKKVKTAYFFPQKIFMVVTNATSQPVSVHSPDVDDQAVVDVVCAEVTKAKEDCERWTQCCRAAKQCCERQLSSDKPGIGGLRAHIVDSTGAGDDDGDADGDGQERYCPRTWDGYSCWDDTEPGISVTTSCASYIDHSSSDNKAVKRCMDNGTWFLSPESRQEWTDYTACVEIDTFVALLWVGVACNVISLILLAPACFIFLYFRSLRHQHRIKLHVCLFSSYIMTNVLMILWELIVVNDRLNNQTDQAVIHQNSVGCRFLHSLTRYTWTTNFLWMWLEGFHLYRLMVHAFAVPRSLVGFYIGGFASPLVPTLIYVIIRATNSDLNTRCWVGNAGDFEWIIYTPIIFCIVGNIFFLGKIMWVMVNQLQSHPNEPSSYRRAVKAAGILIPLFGLQVLLVVFRPSPPVFALEVLSTIVTNTQGAAVAIGFCYFNGEVLTVIRNALPRSMRSRSLLRADQRSTMSTQFTTDMGSRSVSTHPHYQTSAARVGANGNVGSGYTSQREHTAGYIPLSTLGDDVKGDRTAKNDSAKNGVA